MKLLYFTLLAWFAYVPVSYGQAGITNVHEVALSSATSFTISVPSQTAVAVGSNTNEGLLNGAFAVEVYNLAASTSTLNCAFTVNVSTVANSAFYGREVSPGVGVVFQTAQNQVPVYCKTQNTGGITRATVTQLK